MSLSACTTPRPLVIGIHPWPGYEPLYLAQAFGWLPADVQLRSGMDASETLAGLRAGELDGGALTLDEVLTARAEGIPLTVLLVMNVSVGADVVLARPEIQTLADLRGKRIAVEHSAVGGIVLAKLLAAADLTLDDVHLLPFSPSEQLEPWQAGHIDVAVSYYPAAAHLEREGAVRLLDSRQFPNTIFDVLAVRQDRLRWRTATLKALVAAHFRGLEHIRINRDDALRRIAAWRNLDVAETVRGFAGLDLPRVAGNRYLLAPQGGVWQSAEMLNTLMVANGLLSEPVTLQGLVQMRYLPQEDPR